MEVLEQVLMVVCEWVCFPGCFEGFGPQPKQSCPHGDLARSLPNWRGTESQVNLRFGDIIQIKNK
jgi:hypothetical protein